jgi:hypothetical protein
MEHPFDHMAKGLADEVSRREALRRLGGGLATALLGSLGLRTAWGQSSGCQSYCRARVRSPKAFTECVISCQDCLQGEGTLCGVSAGGVVTCCGFGLTCINGNCHPVATAVCGNEICSADEKCCSVAPLPGLPNSGPFGTCIPDDAVCCPSQPLLDFTAIIWCPPGTTCCLFQKQPGIAINDCCSRGETCCVPQGGIRCCGIGETCCVGRGHLTACCKNDEICCRSHLGTPSCCGPLTKCDDGKCVPILQIPG